jgi:hypothetical protein
VPPARARTYREASYGLRRRFRDGQRALLNGQARVLRILQMRQEFVLSNGIARSIRCAEQPRNCFAYLSCVAACVRRGPYLLIDSGRFGSNSSRRFYSVSEWKLRQGCVSLDEVCAASAHVFSNTRGHSSQHREQSIKRRKAGLKVPPQAPTQCASSTTTRCKRPAVCTRFRHSTRSLRFVICSCSGVV